MLDFTHLGPYDRVTFRGRQMNARDAAMCLAAEELFAATVYISQGGFNPGGVGASAGTHDKGGAVDWSLAGMSPKQKRRWDHAVKDVGWCSWHRPAIDGLWPEHQHAVARGCKNLSSPVATNQIGQFDARESGLIGDAYDPSYRPDPKVEFDYSEWKQDWLLERKDRKLRQRINGWRRGIKGLRRKILAARKARREIKRKRNH